MAVGDGVRELGCAEKCGVEGGGVGQDFGNVRGGLLGGGECLLDGRGGDGGGGSVAAVGWGWLGCHGLQKGRQASSIRISISVVVGILRFPAPPVIFSFAGHGCSNWTGGQNLDLAQFRSQFLTLGRKLFVRYWLLGTTG